MSFTSRHCHSERNAGSLSFAREICRTQQRRLVGLGFRFAQNDNQERMMAC